MVPYPYLPPGWKIQYVPKDNVFMQAAKEHARKFSLDTTMPTASVIVKNGEIIGVAANGSDYHQKQKCERVRLNIPTGQGYELCEGCHPKNHSESKAIQDTRDHGYDMKGSDLYLWGHWWCCESCWDTMLAAGIQNIFLLEGSETHFDKNHPDNIVGKQFA